MKSRLEILHHLLSEDGAIFVHLDDNESDYCKVLLDEIFDRKNFMNRITIAARSPSAFSVVNPGLFVAAESILYYAKNRSRYAEHHLRVERSVDYAHDKWIVDFDKPRGEGEKYLLRKVAKDIAGFKLSYKFEKRAIQFGTRIAHMTNVHKYGSNNKANGKAKFEEIK